MQLLQDVFVVENLQVLTEGKTNPTMKIKGIFGRCNEKNNNGRIYPTAVLEGQLSKVQPMINERRLCGELDHPQNDTVKLSNASHLITKLEMKGDELIGEAELLNTPAGLTAKALVEGGVKIGISSRGMGTLSEDANGQKIVNEDFRLVTFDLVADPSTRGAFPGLSESTESQFVRESQDKLQKEANFVTMIEARLRDSYAPFVEEATKKKPLKGGQTKLDKNQNGMLDAQDFKMLRKESIEAVKEEGSWHKIAFSLAEAMGLLEMDFNDPDMSPSEVRKTRYRRVSALERGNRMSRAEASKMKRDARVQSTAAEDAALKDHKLTAAREEDKSKKKRRKR